MTTVARSFRLVTPLEVGEVWWSVEPGVARALAGMDGEGRPEDFREALEAGRMGLLLFPGQPALGIIFQFVQMPRVKICRVLSAFGGDMEAQREAMEDAEAWFKEQGCKWVEAWVASESRARLFARFGYRPRYTVIRKELP